MRVASIEGLEGLTIGRLARDLGMTKSGVYAHFGSKEQLQHETIDAAQQVMEREVIAPALAAPPGIDQLHALADAFLSYVERLVFPGGCFFASLLAEMDAREGPFRAMAQQGAREWLGMIHTMVTDAQQQGQLEPTQEAGLIAFQLDACLEAANYYYVLLDDPAVIDNARQAIRMLLDRRGPNHPTATATITSPRVRSPGR